MNPTTPAPDALLSVTQVDELRTLIAKATGEDLSDDGRYFAETYTDLTRCRHEEIGEYQHSPDGKLVEWLWNKRHEIADLFDARHRLAALADQRGGVEALREIATLAADARETDTDTPFSELAMIEQMALAALATPAAPELRVGDGEWFYPEGDHSSDECRFSPDEVIDYALEGESKSQVVAIERAASLPTIYAAVRVWTDAEKDARESDEDYDYTLFASFKEASAALAARPLPGGE